MGLRLHQQIPLQQQRRTRSRCKNRSATQRGTMFCGHEVSHRVSMQTMLLKNISDSDNSSSCSQIILVESVRLSTVSNRQQNLKTIYKIHRIDPGLVTPKPCKLQDTRRPRAILLPDVVTSAWAPWHCRPLQPVGKVCARHNSSSLLSLLYMSLIPRDMHLECLYQLGQGRPW